MEKELKLVFDSSERLVYDGTVDFSIKSSLIDIPIKTRELLEKDCQTVFTCRQVSSKSAYSSGSTYFLKSSQKPRCALERLALDIFNYHTQNAQFDKSNSGVEWWTQVINAADDIGFHFDRDYGIESECNMFVYPHLATVTYLTNIGNPTIVINKTSTDDYESLECSLSEVHLSRASYGKHLSFDGMLLHGAPEVFDIKESEGKNRITFLANIWMNHIPIESSLMPRAMLKDFSCVTFEPYLITPITNTASMTCSVSEDNLHWEFKHSKDRYVISMPPLNEEDFISKTLDFTVAKVVFERGSLKIQKKSKKRKKTIS